MVLAVSASPAVVTTLERADDEGKRDANAGRWPRRRVKGEPMILRRAYLAGYNDELGRMARVRACPQLELWPAPGVERVGKRPPQLPQERDLTRSEAPDTRAKGDGVASRTAVPGRNRGAATG